MLLAELDANGWALIIGAIFLGLGQIAQMVLSYLRDKAAAAKVEKVAVTLGKVQHATNSLTSQLVEKTEAEALARGGVEERARADLRAEV